MSSTSQTLVKVGKRAAIIAALFASLAGAATAGGPMFDGPTIKNPRLTPNFALTDQSGHRVELYRLHGKVVLLTFLYTHCPDACPLTANRLNAALRSLGAARSNVDVLAVSVDPKGDTPSSVRAFIAQHRLLPDFHYLTATRSILAPIWHAYGVESYAHAGDRVDHTLYTLLIDRHGYGRVLYDSTATVTAVAHDTRLLLGR